MFRFHIIIIKFKIYVFLNFRLTFCSKVQLKSINRAMLKSLTISAHFSNCLYQFSKILLLAF